MVSTPLYDPLALALGSEEDDLLNFAPKTGLFAHLGQEARRCSSGEIYVT
jgi:hypothetical protein